MLNQKVVLNSLSDFVIPYFLFLIKIIQVKNQYFHF